MSEPPIPPAALSFGPFVLDRASGRLLRDGQPLDLAPRPWAVLAHLCGQAGRLVSKEELLDAVWGHRHVSDSALKVVINSLRGKLADDPVSPRYIETVARRGYRFIAALGSAPTAQDGSVGAAATDAPADPAPGAQPPAAAADAAVPAVVAMPGAEPVARAAGIAGNLPASAAMLVGREPALAELRARLAEHRLVTLLGPGGVGKTQLAMAAARLDPPADGVWLVRLESLADAGPLLDTIARTLALGANASRSPQALALALSPLSVRIVLDNAEHLIEPLAPLVAQCLAEAPRLQLLVTSQIPLRVAGELLQPLQPLEVPPAEGGADVIGYAAVALFVQRVRSVLPAFAPDARELQAIGRLVRLLDGLPLAIELAAARVPLLGTAGVLARMADRFALLSRGARDAPQRHRTLRQALEWSFGLLGEDELRVLRRVSVFAGAFTTAMAEAVAGDEALPEWAVLDALQNLQEHSLLVIESAGGEPRLRQLESVRALAAEHLRSAGEEAATRTRLAQVLDRRFAQAQAMYTRTPLLDWLPPLRPEADHLRLAMAHAVEQVAAEPPGAGCSSPLRLAVGLFSHAMLFWLRSGRKREAHGWYEALAPHAGRLNDPGLRAHYGLAIGALAAYGQSLPQAEAFPWLDEAEASFTRLGDPRNAMLALYLHAALMQRVDPSGDRTPLLQRMRALEQPDWSPRERNFAAWTEAVNAHGHGNLQAFRDFCADDLARSLASGDRAEAWVAAFGLGQALWILNERERALEVLADAVRDLRASGLLREYATTAALAASMRLAVGSTDDQDAAMREAADVTRAEGMLWWMGDALMLLPARRGEWPAALRLRDWIDGRMQALGMKRSPVASSLRQAFDDLLDEARAPGWQEPPRAGAPALDDAEVLRLSFG